jgi:flagellar basal body-associated protein FliL
MLDPTNRILAVLAALLLALFGAEYLGYTNVLSMLHGRPLVIAGLTSGSTEGFPDEDPGDLDTPHIREEFLIPMRDEELDRYLRTTVVIEFYDTDTRDDLLTRVGKLRDAFIVRAVNLNPQTLDGPAGIKQCKALMRAALKETRAEAQVKAVYFSEFVIHSK